MENYMKGIILSTRESMLEFISISENCLTCNESQEFCFNCKYYKKLNEISEDFQ